MVLESCGSQSKGIPGGSENSSSLAMRPAVCRGGVEGGGLRCCRTQVMLERDRRC